MDVGVWVTGSILALGGILGASWYTQDKEKQIECLAKNLYFEVGNQGTAGMLAVSSVVINRVNDDRFPNTMCKVIYQKRGGVCQFSWYCDKKSDNPSDKKIYREKLDFVRKLLDNERQWVDITDGATNYHANYVRPSWRKRLKRTTEIDKHIFYRWSKK